MQEKDENCSQSKTTNSFVIIFVSFYLFFLHNVKESEKFNIYFKNEYVTHQISNYTEKFSVCDSLNTYYRQTEEIISPKNVFNKTETCKYILENGRWTDFKKCGKWERYKTAKNGTQIFYTNTSDPKPTDTSHCCQDTEGAIF